MTMLSSAVYKKKTELAKFIQGVSFNMPFLVSIQG